MRFHTRTIIRQEFVSLLKDKTIAKANVFDSRLYPMERSSFPGIIVFSNNEEVATTTIGYPRLQERVLQVSVECYMKSTKEVNTEADNLSAQIEKIILSTPNLRGACKTCKLESTEVSLNSDGDMPVAVLTLVFLVEYNTREGAKEGMPQKNI